MTEEIDYVEYDFNPNRLPIELLRAIGLTAAAAAQTEHIMGQLIGGLLRIDDVDTEALTTEMSNPLKDRIIRSLLELKTRHVSEIDKVDELLDAARAAIEKRNTIVHNSFCQNPVTGEVLSLRTTAKNSLKFSLQAVTPAEIEKVASEIYEAGMAIMTFMISRGLLPHHRPSPLLEQFPRGPKARKQRQ